MNSYQAKIIVSRLRRLEDLARTIRQELEAEIRNEAFQILGVEDALKAIAEIDEK